MDNKIANILFTLFFQFAFGQIEQVRVEPSNIDKRTSFNKITASPEIAAFQKINFLPINLYTGKPDVNIQLYSIKSGDIEIPISIKYDIGANKVDDIASNTGWGWSLNAGGNVTRIVRDIDDHDYDIAREVTNCTNNGTCDDFNLQLNGTKLLKLGYLRRVSDGSNNADGYFLSNLNEDALPDLFIVNAPGLSNQFYLERNFIQYNPSQGYKAVILNGGIIKISDIFYKKFNTQQINNFGGFNYQDAVPNIGYNYIFNYNNGINVDNPLYQIRGYGTLPGLMNTRNNDYEDFNIINDKGIKYEFSTYDISESAAVFYGEDSPYWRQDNHILFPNLSHFSSTYKIKKSAWHLNQIKDTENRVVNFFYKPMYRFEYDKVESYSGLVQAPVHEVDKIAFGLDSGIYYNSIANLGIFDTYPNINLTDEQYQEFPEFIQSIGGNRTLYKSENLNKITQQQLLEKIEWDSGEVSFFYDLQRMDKVNSKALTEIKVKNRAGILIKHYKFNYSYFISGDIDCPSNNDPKCYRLKLDSIEDLDINLKKISNYTFEYDNKNIPRLYSNSKDFLGYFNGANNIVEQNQWGTEFYYTPKFTFIPGKARLSILPFQSAVLDPNSFIQLGHQSNISPTNNSLNGLLKKITYPTGGNTILTYENNMFNLEGNDIFSGGARVKSQILNDVNGSTTIKEYEYLGNDGKSSGVILNFPKIADLLLWNSSNKNLTFQTYSYNKSNIELTQNAYVGYTKVTEKVVGKGRTEYFFNSAKEYPNEYEFPETSFFSKHSFYPGRSYSDHDNRRGTLKNIFIYDNNGNLLAKETHSYNEYKIINSQNHNFTVSSVSKNQNGFFIPKKEIHSVKIINSINRSSHKEIIDYRNGTPIVSKTEYFYNNPANFKLSKTKSISPDNVINETTYSYAHEKGNQLMIDKNMVDIVMETSTAQTIGNNTKALSRTETMYPLSLPHPISGDLLKPLSLKSYNIENNNPSTEVSYDKYDNKGNLQQYTTKDGVPTVMIWGYSQTLPIAKIEGKDAPLFLTTFNTDLTVLSNASNNDVDPSTEEQFRAKLDTFQKRQFNLNVSITTYTHDPLVGVTSITPPSGIREVYLYDSANRLEKVVDANGKVLKEYQYHYKN